MITSKIKFKCKLCSQAQSWYIMPLEVKKGNSFIHSKTQYKLVCRKCGKAYLLQILIKEYEGKSNGRKKY